MGPGGGMGEARAVGAQKPPGRLFGALRLPSEPLQWLQSSGGTVTGSEQRGRYLAFHSLAFPP